MDYPMLFDGHGRPIMQQQAAETELALREGAVVAEQFRCEAQQAALMNLMARVVAEYSVADVFARLRDALGARFADVGQEDRKHYDACWANLDYCSNLAERYGL